ncbi:hypothetical protein [Salimicrobium album]|uniref:Uncharacterized protein n=1 Tax=Salimicrobium album TaxID=50717 RepID=A0A1H3HIS1_9BACI|nr:hypothetical protein [Salimicrobium album]SDY15381.1 hypothetical protein SAMN04488081_2232 [Salimicrobium album]
MSNTFHHLFNSIVGILILVEGGLFIFTNNKDGDLHLRSIIMTGLLLLAWGMSYYKQVKGDRKTEWLIFTIIIMIPMILPFLFFI